MIYFLINSSSNRGRENKKLSKFIDKISKENEVKTVDLVTLGEKANEFAEKLKEEDIIYICGGDGTISIFLNSIKDIQIKCRVFVYKNGSGNDLAREFKGKYFEITDVVHTMPHIKANDDDFVCINGCGMGVDAFVCYLKKEYDKRKIVRSYTRVCFEAFKKYKPYNLDVYVDGVFHHYNNVWFIVCNHGKYFGGGKKVTPLANRHDGLLDVCIVYNCSTRLKALMIFPFVSLGIHRMLKKHVDYFQCKEVSIDTKDTLYLQIDGEVKEGIHYIRVNS